MSEPLITLIKGKAEGRREKNTFHLTIGFVTYFCIKVTQIQTIHHSEPGFS